DTKLGGGLWWSQDGRIFCSLNASTKAGDQMDANLWEVKLDPQTGKGGSNPRRLTNWPGFLQFPNGSADGMRLVFVRDTANPDVYVSELEANGTRLKTSPRRLTLDERDDEPAAWTPDSKAVIFSSNRSGNYDIFKQTLDKDTAEPVVATPQVESVPRLSCDGSWIVYGIEKAD